MVHFAASLASAGIFYVVLAMVIKMGIPPLYHVWRFSVPSEEHVLEIMSSVVPAFLGLMVAATISTMNIHAAITLLAWLLSAVMSFWLGSKMRSALQREVNAPLEWLAQLLPLQLTAILTRRPMLLFDFWTIGLVVMFLILEI